MPKVAGKRELEFVGDSCLVYRAPSSTRFGLFHYVMLLNGSEFKCSCEGFSFNGHCWHVDKLIEYGEMMNEAQQNDEAPFA